MSGSERLRTLERVVADGDPPATRAPAGRGAALAGCTLLAACVAVAVAWLERRAIPDDALLISGQRAKFEDLAQRGREFDLLFFGSSTLYRGVSPDIVDARLAELGHPLRSYNCAFAAGFSFETDWILRRVVPELTGPGPAGEPQRLRIAVVEFPDWSPEQRNMGALRTIAWHDATGTENAIRSVVANEGALDALLDGAEHVRHLFLRTLGIGLGPRGISDAFGAARGPSAGVLRGVLASRGFSPLFDGSEAVEEDTEPESDIPQAERHAQFVATGAKFEAEVAALRDGRGKGHGLEHYPLAALRSQRDFLAAHGVRVVYVVAPVPWKVEHARRLAQEGEAPLLSFNDPVRYPELFSFERRMDRAHLSVEGAALFSADLAEALAALLDAPRDAAGLDPAATDRGAR